MKRFIIIITMLMAVVSIFAQGKISGTVVDTENQPLIGVLIVPEGSDVAVVSDIDGRFEINVAEGGNVTFSMLGLKSKTIPATDGMVVVMSKGGLAEWNWRKVEWENILLAEYGYEVTGMGLHSIGLRYGRCHYAGWYVGARYLTSEFKFRKSEGTTDGEGFITEPNVGRGIPVFTGITSINQFTLSAGLMWKMYIPLYGYAGAGYGYRQTLHETTADYWLGSKSDKSSLAVVEFGLIGDFRYITLSAGCEVVFAGSTEVYPKVGIGYVFPTRKRK